MLIGRFATSKHTKIIQFIRITSQIQIIPCEFTKLRELGLNKVQTGMNSGRFAMSIGFLVVQNVQNLTGFSEVIVSNRVVELPRHPPLAIPLSGKLILVLSLPTFRKYKILGLQGPGILYFWFFGFGRKQGNCCLFFKNQHFCPKK